MIPNDDQQQIRDMARQLTEVYLGIRPEHISDQVSDESEASLRLAASLTHCELLGAEYLNHAQSSLGPLRYLRKNRGAAPHANQQVDLRFSLQDLHFFSGQHQQNLLREMQYA